MAEAGTGGTLRLPPLDCLRFFEAAARRRSFALAAEELHVTPPAVAHRIRTLERHLGAPLFERHSRGVRLNRRGDAYLADIAGLLVRIRDATDRCSGDPARLLRIGVESAAARWLAPRLATFHAAYPDIVVEVETWGRVPADAAHDFHVTIADVGANTTVSDEAACREPLFDDALIPVCSPALLDRRGSPSAPRDLDGWPLLLHLGRATDWPYWFARRNESPPDLSRAWGFRLYGMVLKAAVDGIGAAVGHASLISTELESGTLVALFDDAPVSARCCLTVAPDSVAKPEVLAFRAWLPGGPPAPAKLDDRNPVLGVAGIA